MIARRPVKRVAAEDDLLVGGSCEARRCTWSKTKAVESAGAAVTVMGTSLGRSEGESPESFCDLATIRNGFGDHRRRDAK